MPTLKNNTTQIPSIHINQVGQGLAVLHSACAKEEYLYYIGYSYYKLGYYNDAFNYINESILLDSLNTNAFSLRGTINTELEKYELSIEDYNKAIELDSLNKYPYNNMGWIYMIKRNYDSALKYYDKAISLDSNFIISYRQ